MNDLSTSRLAARFDTLKRRGRTGLIPYIAAGDPSVAMTVELMQALARAGADVIELGVPFSDPSADGAVVQRAAERAIRNGVGLAATIDCVRAFRRDDDVTPVVLMGYANPFELMASRRGGLAALAADLREAGVDGVLVVDYPPEESEDFSAALMSAGIASIYMLAPTSSESSSTANGLAIPAINRSTTRSIAAGRWVPGAGRMPNSSPPRRATSPVRPIASTSLGPRSCSSTSP